MKTFYTLLITLLYWQLSAQELTTTLTWNESGIVELQAHPAVGFFAVYQEGFIQSLEEDDTPAKTLLDIRNTKLVTGGELGLLGLAFHPQFPDQPYFYTNYTAQNDAFQTMTLISRWTYLPESQSADPNSELILLSIDQPYSNHNGGCIQFGPDGYLYIGMGDGGSGGDPQGFAQNRQSLLGKMLRLDVTTDIDQYLIPDDNPFADDDATMDEIWTLGMRNPWKFSFDRLNGDLWIGDVGQNLREEIHFQAANHPGGDNYGWNCKEGFLDYNDPSSACDDNPVLVDPLLDYGHVNGNGCSITGGYVYRGCQYPDLYGKYIYGDFCSGRIWVLAQDEEGNWANEIIYETNGMISTFGEDEYGEMYVVDYFNGVYKIGDDNPFIAGIAVSTEEHVLNTQPLHPNNSYQWYLDGVAIDGATSYYYTATESGSYTVEVTTENGCSYISDAITLNINAINELPYVEDFSIHPIPFDENLFIEIALQKSTQVNVKLLDLSGRIIMSKDQYDKDINLTFDTASLESGTYFIQVEIDGQSSMHKIVSVK